MRAALICLALLFTTAPARAQRGPDTAPAKGAQAPDFTLHRLEADGTSSKETVKLSELCQTKPVALVFGSYT